jgi:hypothetical protein
MHDDFDDILGSDVSSFFDKNKFLYRPDQIYNQEQSDYVP